MLAAAASAPNEASEGGAAEGEEHGEHEEAPLETKIAAKLRRRRVSRSHRQAR
jgi:cobalt-zinc-cadmium efflux system membrane fusion protein